MSRAARFPWLLIVLIAGCAPRALEMAIERPVCVDCPSLEPFRNAIGLGNINYSSNIREKLEESEISYDQFRASIEKSLRISNLLSGGPNGGGYVLDVQVLDIHRPRIGFTMTSYIIVHYKLLRANGRAPLRDFIVRSEKTLRFSDSIIVLDRSRASIEGAIRGNIENFLTRLLVR